MGGTNIRGELVDSAGTVHAASHEPTAGSDGDATLDAIERVCRALLVEAGDRPVEAVGLAVPGVVDSRTGVVLLAGNLGWRDTAVADILGHRLGIPVLLHHDVNCAGLAERELGAGRGVDDMLAVFIGTGIAASLTVGGGTNQAGELGHVVGAEDGLLRGILDAVGPDGTTVMPAQSWQLCDPAFLRLPDIDPEWYPLLRDHLPPYDPARTPTRTHAHHGRRRRALPHLARRPEVRAPAALRRGPRTPRVARHRRPRPRRRGR